MRTAVGCRPTRVREINCFGTKQNKRRSLQNSIVRQTTAVRHGRRVFWFTVLATQTMTTMSRKDLLNGLRPGEILTWAEVSGIHRIRNGIYHRNGRLVSLLTDFGRINPCYPDFHGDTENTSFYTG